MADAHKNFAYSTILTAPSPATSGTSLVVQNTDGTKFPAVPFNATIWPAGFQPTTANAEIVRVTAVSTDTFTITRTQESTSARTIVVGDQIAASITVATLTDVENTTTANTFMSQSATQRDIVLPVSTNFIATGVVEVGSGFVLEIPATSSLEIAAYTDQSDASATALVPAGIVQMFAGTLAPRGYLLCDGSAVSRSTYSLLFSTVGTNFGVGDGSTTFNVPDFRGRSPVGVGSGTATGATAKTLGSQPTTGNGGEETHTMTTGELVSHNHSLPNGGTGNGANNPGSFFNAQYTNGTAGATGSSTGTGSVGSTTPFNVMHAMSVVNFIIKT